MKVKITPSAACGNVSAPPSKSVAHRALICAALSQKSEVKNLSQSEDISATLGCLSVLGAKLQRVGNSVCIGSLYPFNIEDGTVLDCMESGSTLRFLLPLCMLPNKKVRLTGSARLFERPLGVYEKICAEQGISFEKDGSSLTVCGRLKPGRYSVNGGVSSQFISGLMFALPLIGESCIEVTGKFESRPYVELTVNALRDFGINIGQKGNTFTVPACRYENKSVTVEGDCSNAAFLDALNLLGGDVHVTGLSPETAQGDRAYKQMFKELQSGRTSFDLADCPDLAPVMFALAAARGRVLFTSTKRLKIKESDRAGAMKDELFKLGVETEISEDSVIVNGGRLTVPTQPISSHNDHRIVMAMSLLLTRTGGCIEGAEAINKSFPDFFEKLENLGIGIEFYDN